MLRLGLLLLLVECAACTITKASAVSDAAPSAEDSTPADDSPRADAGGGGASACKPGPLPEDLRAVWKLSPFYVKYLDFNGLPIISSAKPDDRALCVARDVIAQMFASRPELVGRLVERHIRLAIMAKTEVTTDIPEHASLTPKAYWDDRARGLGASLDRPAVSGAEENVLCDPSDRYFGESILVHEFSHAIFNIAIDLYEPDLKKQLDDAYQSAMAAGLFKNTYAATNRDEYWAEGAQDWFDTNAVAIPSNGIHNEIHTRAQLETYDPKLAAVQAAVFGRREWRYSCPTGK